MKYYMTARTWHNRMRRGENPPITNVRAKDWSITISLKDGNMMETIVQEILLNLAEDPTFRGHYKAKDGNMVAAISWNKAKTGRWIMNQLEGTGAHIEPAIDAQILDKYIYKS